MKTLASSLALMFLGGLCSVASAGTLGVMFGSTPSGTQQLILTVGGTQTLAASFTGWWDSTGSHDAGNSNYGVGDANSSPDHHDFFVFDLSGIEGTITGAQLSIGNTANGYMAGIPAGISTLAMFDVSTSIEALEATNSGQVGIFTDLGSGTLFASRTVSAADNGTQVLITLNASALAALNAAEGQEFAIGGALESSTATPEPGTVMMLGSALAGLLYFRRFVR